MDSRTGRDRVETTATGRWPGGDHDVDRARRSSQELVEPGGDHRREPRGSGSPEHGTGGGYSGCRGGDFNGESEILRKWDDKKVEGLKSERD